MEHNDLRKVQLAQLDLLKEVDRICKKNAISYFLTGGSALGAVRHSGFIPWDDDLDIGMLRAEYERFRVACSSELDNDYEYQDWDCDEGYGLCFAKLRIKGTHFVEKQTVDSSADNGIFIDIFPYDKVSQSISIEKRDCRKLYLWKRVILAKKGYLPVEDSIYRKLTYILLKRFYPANVDKVKKRILGLALNNQRADTNYVVTYGGAYGYWKERIKEEWVSSTVNMKFEDTVVPVAKGVKYYLTQIYGNYMELPPIDKRENRHGIIELDWGNYNIRSIMSDSLIEEKK